MLRLLVPVSMAMLVVVLIERGEGDCNQCSKDTKTDDCGNNTYTTNITEDGSFCKTIQGDSSKVAGLCNRFPKGYKIVCTKINGTCEDTCSAAVATGINNLTPILLIAIALFFIAG